MLQTEQDVEHQTLGRQIVQRTDRMVVSGFDSHLSTKINKYEKDNIKRRFISYNANS